MKKTKKLNINSDPVKSYSKFRISYVFREMSMHFLRRNDKEGSESCNIVA